jgi:uncharacterized protein (TIGR00369 family)
MKIIVPFAEHLGLVTREHSEERGVVVLPVRRENSNHIGSQHAGALFSAAEAAAGAAVMGRLMAYLQPGMTPLVRGATIQYTKVAQGQITATSMILASTGDILSDLKANGRVDIDVEVSLTDESGEIVANSQVTWHIRAARKAAA